VLASAYGITDELHQAFVPLRMPDPMDWLVDTVGAAVGALTMWTADKAGWRRLRDQ
jgi:VanZ family protein